MHATPNQGLSGKARRMHRVTRSHRLYSRQLVSEYFDWEEGDEQPERQIPIRRSCEFFPTAEVSSPASPGDSGAGQFAFALTSTEPIARTHLAGKVQTPSADARPSPTPQEPPATITPDKPGVIRPPRLRVKHSPQPVRAPSMSPRGFLVGCAIGGTAAGILLILLGMILG